MVEVNLLTFVLCNLNTMNCINTLNTDQTLMDAITTGRFPYWNEEILYFVTEFNIL